ncbi:spore germination protein [Mesobacillus jeotgali]|uniref:spore germination protein n=1 Tax=Mesobacillus jeotgali TaxID=129985 RepID=UPI001783C228|nr:spore germination protein [Mesobacillus jeotgali]UYZ21271.1 spore germination protein [Mesobacillus jeotgali]
MKKFRLPAFNNANRKVHCSGYQIIKAAFQHTGDFKELEFKRDNTTLLFCFLETLISEEKFKEYLLIPLLLEDFKRTPEELESLNGKKVDNPEELISGILNGGNVLFLCERDEAWLFSFPKDLQRSIQEPVNEGVVRGPHDGFVENLDTNISQLRFRIKSPDFKVKYHELGNKTKTKTAVIYMKGIADEKLVEEVERRLSFISTDMILSPGYIEEFIEDDPFSLFPQLINTERPDRAMANLMEGRIIIIGEGSPTALILPVTFFAFYQSSDDYNSRWIPSTFIRMLRYVSFLIAITLPAFYIAIIAYHLEVIPHELILPLKGSVEGIPYPPLLEAFFMEITIELIREAGVRLPKPIGQTIGIVGGLVIGDAVVSAGLISNIMIVIVALTAISAFVVPSNEMSTSVRLIRFPLMVLASILGFVGLTFGLIFVFIKLCKLESFGVPYFSPLAPLQVRDLKDTFLRLPLWKMDERPRNSLAVNVKRQRDSRGWKTNEPR